MKVKFDANDFMWLAVREKPTKESRMVRKIKSGTEFEVLSDAQDGWYPVQDGYVMASFVAPIDGGTTELEKMKVSELRKLAKDSGITLKNGMTKPQIIEAILNG